MPVKGITAATEIIEPKLKIAIVGDTGIGKSWLATSIATDSHKVLDLDFDGRAASLQGKANVYVKTYIDKDPNNPTAVADLESDINDWEFDFSMGRLQFQTFIIDSGSYLRKAIEREIIRQQSTLSRPLKIGPKTIRIGQGYDVFNGNLAYFEHVVSRLSSIGNLVVTFHERNEKDEVRSTKDTKAFTGMITIDPQHLAAVLSTFNDVWRITSNYAGKRVVQTGLSSEFIGKTTLQGLAEEEEPDIRKMLAKSLIAAAKSAAEANKISVVK